MSRKKKGSVLDRLAEWLAFEIDSYTAEIAIRDMKEGKESIYTTKDSWLVA